MAKLAKVLFSPNRVLVPNAALAALVEQLPNPATAQWRQKLILDGELELKKPGDVSIASLSSQPYPMLWFAENAEIRAISMARKWLRVIDQLHAEVPKCQPGAITDVAVPAFFRIHVITETVAETPPEVNLVHHMYSNSSRC
ncbi:hypothetical protein [Martelella soudanensis]|uniref:hypothetical protein n=1 Tax=unclassified Martelella TaxID=2629616 RepID=UPI0015DF352F|nr:MULTISPECIES: hypothetical protein [unclassified Martelella]